MDNAMLMKGGIVVKEKKPVATFRDYGKPMVLELRGTDGFRKYVTIATSPRTPYDAKKAAKKAARNLERQGLSL